ncbi:serine hydrolase domain-containing protein [Streptomyces sp. NPDC006668]|uniref:serine hydrolase domain-containing protein n=1 Tax=Streptomyces sp. NPDC006668 TaxID=3156903 RepID=UPI0033C3B020
MWCAPHTWNRRPVEGPDGLRGNAVAIAGVGVQDLTATALMCLVAVGQVDLHAPVRGCVPELRLAEEQAAAQISVLNLLNHTAGLDWNLIDDGDGDRSLAGLVDKLPQLPLIAPPGTCASYSRAGYNLAGPIIEKVMGLPFERAMASLVLEPVGLTDTVYGLSEVMVRKFAVGYNRGDEGERRLARPGSVQRRRTRQQPRRRPRLHGERSAALGAARPRRRPGRAARRRTAPHAGADGRAARQHTRRHFGICWFLHDQVSAMLPELPHLARSPTASLTDRGRWLPVAVSP